MQRITPVAKYDAADWQDRSDRILQPDKPQASVQDLGFVFKTNRRREVGLIVVTLRGI